MSVANLERFRSIRRQEAAEEAKKNQHKFQKSEFISLKDKVIVS